MSNLTLRESIKTGLIEALESDTKVFLMGEDIGDYNGAYAVTAGLLKKFGPKRIIDTPISESVILGTGIGAAAAGLRPIVEIMTINFLLLAFDQLINHAAKLRYMSNGQIEVPLVLRTVTGGGAQLGATHSQSFEGWLAAVPGLKVVCPSTPKDALGLFRTSMKQKDPVVFAEHALLYGVKEEVPDEFFEIPFGKANIKRSGDSITIISYSGMVRTCMAASEIISKDFNVECEVIDLRTLRPLDFETIIKSVKKTGRAVVVEETWKTGGFGANISESIQLEAFDYLDGPIIRIASEDVPAPYNRKLELGTIPSEEKIVAAIKQNFSI
ncbi:MAG: alpha-ketoacid dehydrogenase subunit beta [Chloroflexi bacterium]|jgi:pyruvate/2-oxoglutarate/acetoin dehydrogenase E1 component|nr:alpha-ketoacid dehydrogenase subunit beta [Chloroflexota bacterium]|tara:strand:- start:28933 stop:29913 length:981 start_codon:yes stop_codon:yes gene_type:complete